MSWESESATSFHVEGRDCTVPSSHLPRIISRGRGGVSQGANFPLLESGPYLGTNNGWRSVTSVAAVAAGQCGWTCMFRDPGNSVAHPIPLKQAQRLTKRSNDGLGMNTRNAKHLGPKPPGKRDQDSAVGVTEVRSYRAPQAP